MEPKMFDVKNSQEAYQFVLWLGTKMEEILSEGKSVRIIIEEGGAGIVAPTTPNQEEKPRRLRAGIRLGA